MVRKTVKKTVKKPVSKKKLSPPALTGREKILQDLDNAVLAGQFLVAVFRIQQGRIHLEWTKENFPDIDVSALPTLLKNGLLPLAK